MPIRVETRPGKTVVFMIGRAPLYRFQIPACSNVRCGDPRAGPAWASLSPQREGGEGGKRRGGKAMVDPNGIPTPRDVGQESIQTLSKTVLKLHIENILFSRLRC